MLSAESRARLAVVLVGARNPQNIGAAARAMHDFGFSDLRVVNEFAAPFEAAQLEADQLEAAQFESARIEADWSPLSGPAPKSAVRAEGVMRAARRFNRLADAIADCTLVVGTTAIGGRDLSRRVVILQGAAPAILEALASAVGETAQAGKVEAGEVSPQKRVALLFGSEKTGLTREQLSHCALLTTIPMFAPLDPRTGEPARHLSMNLGQSVAVCLYELVREGFEGARELPAASGTPATGDDRERLTQSLLEAMEGTGYARRFPANAREHVVRQLALQLGATHDEAATWMGFFRQVLRRAGDQEDANSLRE